MFIHEDPALTLDDPVRARALEAAHAAIAPMFWGERLSLSEACSIIQAWLAHVRPWAP
jgi:hypothetical protein